MAPSCRNQNVQPQSLNIQPSFAMQDDFRHLLHLGDLAFPEDERRLRDLDAIARTGGSPHFFLKKVYYYRELKVHISSLRNMRYRSADLPRVKSSNGANQGSPSIEIITVSFASTTALQLAMRSPKTSPTSVPFAPYTTMLHPSTSTSRPKRLWRSSPTYTPL